MTSAMSMVAHDLHPSTVSLGGKHGKEITFHKHTHLYLLVTVKIHPGCAGSSLHKLLLLAFHHNPPRAVCRSLPRRETRNQPKKDDKTVARRGLSIGRAATDEVLDGANMNVVALRPGLRPS